MSVAMCCTAAHRIMCRELHFPETVQSLVVPMEETVQSEELLKQRFFMDDVLTALQRMNPEGAERILKKCNLCDLINYVNQEQGFWDRVYDFLEEQVKYYNETLADYRELNDLLNATAQEKADRTIADITEVYKNMDVVDKVRLNRRLQKENTLADSICLLLGYG